MQQASRHDNDVDLIPDNTHGTRSDVGEDEIMLVFEHANPANFDFAALFRHCINSMARYMVLRYYRVV